jgi:hypothetical protein
VAAALTTAAVTITKMYDLARAPEASALLRVVVMGRLLSFAGAVANEIATRKISRKLRSFIVRLL